MRAPASRATRTPPGSNRSGSAAGRCSPCGKIHSARQGRSSSAAAWRSTFAPSRGSPRWTPTAPARPKKRRRCRLSDSMRANASSPSTRVLTTSATSASHHDVWFASTRTGCARATSASSASPATCTSNVRRSRRSQLHANQRVKSEDLCARIMTARRNRRAAARRRAEGPTRARRRAALPAGPAARARAGAPTRCAHARRCCRSRGRG